MLHLELKTALRPYQNEFVERALALETGKAAPEIGMFLFFFYFFY